MKKDNQKKSISRRKFLPFLGGGLLLPFFGSAKTVEKIIDGDQEEYQTLLTKDGKTVKVRKGAVDGSKVVDKELSNTSLMKWLKKDDKTLNK